MDLGVRNTTIDMSRFIAAFFVVSLHTKFPIPIGAFIADIGKMAVPFFLLVSGFFLYSNEEILIHKKAYKAIKKVFLILVEVCLVYAILRLTRYFFFNLKVPKFDPLDFLLFNDTSFTEHLWYLFAFVYVLFVLLILSKFNLLEKVLNFLPVFIIFLIICATWTRILPLTKAKFIYELNWFITGIPYVFLGMWVKKNYNILKSHYLKYKKWVPYIFAFLFFGLFVEHFIYKKLFGEGPGVIVTIVFSTLLFIISSFNVNIFGQKIDYKISMYGKKHALNIYLYHVLIREIIYFTRGFKVEVSILNNTVTIFMLSLLLSILIEGLKKLTYEN